jgi:hypothetical protein
MSIKLKINKSYITYFFYAPEVAEHVAQAIDILKNRGYRFKASCKYHVNSNMTDYSIVTIHSNKKATNFYVDGV